MVVTPLILRIFEGQTTLRQRLINLKIFYVRRFYRLAPALAATLGISAVAILFLGPTSDHERYASQGIATLLVLGNFGAYRYSGDYFSPNPNPLIHTWSLSVEEQIYIFLPLILMLILVNRKRMKQITSILFLFIALVSFISFLVPTVFEPIYSQIGIQNASRFSFYSPVARIWQFSLGSLVFFMFNGFKIQSKYISRFTNSVLIFGLFLILFAPIPISTKTGSILASCVATAVIIFRSLEVLPKLLSHALEWLGDRSYSIYLVHMPLLYLAIYSPLTSIGEGDNRIFQSIIAVTLSIILGSLSYSKVENRFRGSSKSAVKDLKTVAVTLLLTLLIPLLLFIGLERLASSVNVDAGFPIPKRIAPYSWDSSCLLMSDEYGFNEKPCKYGELQTNKSILLIGDSHAASDSRAITNLGKSNEMNVFVFAYAGCSFVLNSSGFNPSYNYPDIKQECLMHNQLILDFVRIKKPTIIIIALRNSRLYVEPNNSVSRDDYRKLVLKNLLELKKFNSKIIMIGSENEYLPISTYFQKFVGGSGRYSQVSFEDNQFWMKAAIGNFYYLDTLKIFCPQGVCMNRIGENWLFHDGDHLSEIGSSMLLPELDYIVKEILKHDSM